MKAKTLLLAGMMLPGVALAQLKPEDVYQKVLPSVMTLQVENAQGEHFVGSAFLALGDGVAVTSWHVISDATKVTAKLSDNQSLEVRGLIDKDEKHDLALIRVASVDRPLAQICAAKPRVGSHAYAIGAPKGFEFSITDGLISQIQTVDGYQQFQVSCPISGGNSGGPVVNERGEVMGITSWTKRDAQNLSFATPASFLSGLNIAHTVIPWTENIKPKISATPVSEQGAVADTVRSSAASTNVAELKRVLKESAGHEITVIVVKDGVEKKFDIVAPKGLVNPASK